MYFYQSKTPPMIVFLEMPCYANKFNFCWCHALKLKKKKLFSFKRNVKVLYNRKEQWRGYFVVFLLLSLFWCFFLYTGKGRTGNRWSAITYRIALAIFTRSPSAYEALKSYQILKLPSVASLKHLTSANKQPTGLNLPHLHDAKQAYTVYKEEWKEQGFLEPKEYGGLIFDEVKVVMKVHSNSADNG